MPLVRIDAVGDQIDPIALSHLAQVSAALPANSPCVIMIHGFKFNPRRAARDPHQHILSLTPTQRDPKAVSWPKHLGFRDEDVHGLCIAFGWQADGSLPRAYDAAQSAGRALATLIAFLNGVGRLQQIGLFAHSLGVRVALSALPYCATGAVDRMILMAPAEFKNTAQDFLECRAARHIETLVITSYENILFDRLFEICLAPFHGLQWSMGLDGTLQRNCATLRIDHPQTRNALKRLGFSVSPPRARICHWSAYLRPGMFSIYRAFLFSSLPLDALRGCHAPTPSGPIDWVRNLLRGPKGKRFTPKVGSGHAGL